MRIAIVSPAPAPYREHLFSRLSQAETIKVFSLDGITDWNISASAYPIQKVPLSSIRFFHEFRLLRHFGFDLWRQLTEFNPQVLIVYGYIWWPMMLAIVWGIFHDIPVLMRNDANSIAPRVGVKRWRRKLFGKFLSANDVFALAIGTSNIKYWEQEMGFPRKKIFLAPYTVDNEHFEQNVGHWLPKKENLKSAMGIAGKQVILYVGRLVPHKGIHELIHAYQKLSASNGNISLVIVGQGEEKTRIQEIIEKENFKNVILIGFVRQNELPRYYAVADVFVLPSLIEPWGLVVNEAMASGLPIVVSDKVGAGIDLIRNGENGYIFPSGDETALAEAIEKVLLNPAPYGKRSREIIRSWSVNEEINGFLNAVRSVVKFE